MLIAAPRADAAWGDLDPTFAGVGYTGAAPAGFTYGSLLSMAQQPDGKTVVAGEGGVDFFNSTALIQRLLPDGSLDPTFGSGGSFSISTPAALFESEVRAIALQPDGKIVGVAEKTGDTRLFRLTAGGALDTTFASPNGYVSIADEYPHSVFVAASGDIFIGLAGNSDTVVARRFNSAGVQYASFASNVAAGLSGSVFAGNERVIVKPVDTGLFVVTTGSALGTPIFFAAKFDVVGNLVTSWGASGKRAFAFSTGATPTAALVQPSGALVIGGTTQVMGDSSWTLARLNPAGNVDPTFVGGGKIELNLSTDGDSIGALATSPDGGLLAAGNTTNPVTDDNEASFRLMDADGAPNAAFGPDGMRKPSIVGSPDVNDVVVQPDGKIMSTGSIFTATNDRYPLSIRLQQYVAPVPPAPVLGAKVSSPKGKKISAKKLRKFAGTATTTNDAVTKVEIAVQRVDKKLLKKSKRCLWLSSSKVKFKKVKAVKSKCDAPKWLKATGTSNWSFKLKKKKYLPKASYVLQVRVTSGITTQTFATARKFTVK